MAKNKSTIYLGYQDEEIFDKHAALLNSTVNKIGGSPDWINEDIQITLCPFCGNTRPLIVQLYAPLEHSQFHRTLYIFACLDPICSQNSKSWLCVRTQNLDTPGNLDVSKAMVSTSEYNLGKKKESKKSYGKLTWCRGVDDWGTESIVSDAAVSMATNVDESWNTYKEENGNDINIKNDNYLDNEMGEAKQTRISDEDEEEDDSNSMDNELISGFHQMEMNCQQNFDEDPNANCAVDMGIAAAAATAEYEGNYTCTGATASIYAEIEGAETDVVLVETPPKPERDLIALLKHTSTSSALGPLSKVTDLTLKSYFISVDVESCSHSNNYENYVGTLSTEHIRELYQEYKKQDDSMNMSADAEQQVICGNSSNSTDKEIYERALPAHGDLLFHNFVCNLQRNPGQIIRYSRDSLPLLIAPLQGPLPRCINCNGETICEVQILPTLIPKLKIQQNNEFAPIEYGNVCVFTCLKSCWDTPDKMRYERVIVQAEK